jgi:hypothetical protein
MWDDDGSLTAPKDMRLNGAAPGGVPADLNSCGSNFVIDVLVPVTAVNGDWGLDCDAEGGGQVADTDVLVVRHSAPGKVDPTATKLQVFSERRAAQLNTRLFISDTAPDGVKDGLREVRDMVMQAVLHLAGLGQLSGRAGPARQVPHHRRRRPRDRGS